MRAPKVYRKWIQQRQQEEQRRVTFIRNVQQYISLLAEEVRRLLHVYLSNPPDSGGGRPNLIESEEESRRRISRDPRIRELPESLRERGADIVIAIRNLALDEALGQLGLLRQQLHANQIRVDTLLHQMRVIDEELRPLMLQHVAQVAEEFQPVPLEIPATHESQITKEARKTELAKTAGKQIRGRRAKIFGNYLKLGGLATTDGYLTFLVIATCYEGTAWYMDNLIYALTVSVIIAMIWAGHQIIRGSLLGWLTMTAGTAALGYLRVMIGSAGDYSVASLALAAINILPIPILSYLAAVCMKRAKKLTAGLSTLGQETEKLLIATRTSRRVVKAIKKTNQLNAQLVNAHTRALTRQREIYRVRTQRALQTQMESAMVQLREYDSWRRQSYRLVTRSVLETLAETISLFGYKLAVLSMQDDDSSTGGDGRDKKDMATYTWQSVPARLPPPPSTRL